MWYLLFCLHLRAAYCRAISRTSLLDFAKAIVKVPHQRLHVIQACKVGVGGKLLQWIKMWLTNRSQRVCLKGNVSEWVEVIGGVPQGSVLSPLLFLIYINDLDEDIKSLILKFADDTKIFQKIVREEDSRQLQNDLDVLLQWAGVGK